MGAGVSPDREKTVGVIYGESCKCTPRRRDKSIFLRKFMLGEAGLPCIVHWDRRLKTEKGHQLFWGKKCTPEKILATPICRPLSDKKTESGQIKPIHKLWLLLLLLSLLLLLLLSFSCSFRPVFRLLLYLRVLLIITIFIYRKTGQQEIKCTFSRLSSSSS